MTLPILSTFRLGRIGYLNTLPFTWGLFSGEASLRDGVEERSGTPAEINQKLRQGEVDLAPISSLEYLHHQDDYLLLPGLCIGSRDFSASVLLFSREKIEDLNGAEISVTEESLSAVSLLKIYLKLKLGFENIFRSEKPDPDRMLSRSQACLLIGDPALFYRPHSFLYKTDLSELWWNWTGKPFCFSVWAVRKSFYEAHPRETALFCQRLQKNVKENLADLEKLLGTALGLTPADEKFAVLYSYYFNLNYGLDRAMEEGLVHFFKLAHEAAISPAPRRLEFIEI